VSSGSGGLLDTFGLIFGPDGNGDGNQDLYVPSFKTAGSNKADHKFSTIKRYDGVSGAFIDTFVGPNSGGLDQPNYLIFTETDPVTLAYNGAAKTSAITVAGLVSNDVALLTLYDLGEIGSSTKSPVGSSQKTILASPSSAAPRLPAVSFSAVKVNDSECLKSVFDNGADLSHADTALLIDDETLTLFALGSII
jgi:hypothetical protein